MVEARNGGRGSPMGNDASYNQPIVGATMMFEMLCLLADSRASERRLGR
ncbi:MAG: hypothetical protein ACLQME_21665 [Alphaproteobacteria bacterium]